MDGHVSADDHAVQAGQPLTARDVVVNRGDARARRSTTGYYLVGWSRVRLGARSVKRLEPDQRSSGRRTVSVPVSTAPGWYSLVACADDRDVVSESSETDNCAADDRPVRVRPAARDRIPPTFAGLESATTCTPGPFNGGSELSYELRWDPASDDRTPEGSIVYDVYQADSPGGEDFSEPTYTSPPGATSYSTPGLARAKSWYFVVRARDRAGNRDANEVERQGQDPCV